MPKRLWAALCALLIAIPVLAIVSTSPSSAHTKTVRRCIVDPPINHCWDEAVAHRHGPPPPPDIAPYLPRDNPPPPTTQPPTTQPPTTQPPNVPKAGTRENRPATTTTADACDTWRDELQEALHNPGPDLIPDIPDRPNGCGMSTREMLGKVRTSTAAAERLLRRIMERYGEGQATMSEAQLANAKALQDEMLKAWDTLPPTIQSDLINAGCFVVGLGAGAATAAVTKNPQAAFVVGGVADVKCATALDKANDERNERLRDTPTQDTTPNDDKPKCPSGSFVSGNCQPRDDGGSNTPRETPTPTTQPPPTTEPPFDPATQCRTWLAAIRACINIGPDGRATITYH